jgi:2-C-methyl-D-erythritol 4-phosphate cytidylyltransferase/2-C-methyl-D-erythritol 2,4-cyclodiphosphate synthase
MRTVGLVVAAGRGQRLGGEIPKQYLPLGDAAVIRHCLERLTRHPGVDDVRTVIHPDDRPLYDRAVAGLTLLDPVPGGERRQESVRLGLESLLPLAPAQVLIHDAARPFLDDAMIDGALAALQAAPGAVVAVPVADTVKRAADGHVAETVDRAGLWRAQTPQAFRFADILSAHRAAIGVDLTDDAAVAEQAGLEVRLVAGNENNFKVTTGDDLHRARALMEYRRGGGEYRSGQGLDVHRFGPGDHLTLCGVRIPHDAGLIGFSDADAGLHALTDAILGAIAAGDIGTHFPPGDRRWRDADSAIFLKRAGDLVAARGGRIVNLDLTLICERPRIGPYREAMTARIAEILELDPSRIAIKATTTERLGFTGRGEGLAAQAVATVRLPAPG